MFLSVAAAGLHAETRGAAGALPQPGGLARSTGDLTTSSSGGSLDKTGGFVFNIEVKKLSLFFWTTRTLLIVR